MKEIPKWFKELVIVIIVVLFIRTFLVQAYNIPSGSMKPTLLVDIERLPSLMLGLMFNKNLEPNLIKEAIKHFYLAGIKLTI